MKAKDIKKAYSRVKVREMLFIVLWWTLMLRLIFFLHFLSIHEETAQLIEDKAMSLFRENMIIATLSGLFFGLFISFTELYMLPKWFKDKSFRRVFFQKTIVYIVIVFLFSIIGMGSYIYAHHPDIGFNEYLFRIYTYLHSSLFLYFFLWGLIISFSGNFLRLISRKFGHQQFQSMLIGKYFRPREEERIFLFMDMNSSTRIGRELGHILYSKLLQDCYALLADYVSVYRGELYQFVGDEAVISWKANRKASKENAVMMVLDFQDALKRRSLEFRMKYGVEPVFSAAIGQGLVTVAEVGGEIKREIAYHGQTLHLTSRLLELAKHFNRDLLVPTEFANGILLEGVKKIELGPVELRAVPGAMKATALEKTENNYKSQQIA